MAVPKRKTSPSRRGMRRSADALKAATHVEDKDSGELRRPHHIDLKTGMYRDRQVLEPKKADLRQEPCLVPELGPFSEPVRHGWIARGTKAKYLATKYMITLTAKSSRRLNPSQRDEPKALRDLFEPRVPRRRGVVIATFPRTDSSP